MIKDLNSQKSSKKEPTAITTSKPKKKEVLNVQTKSARQPPKKPKTKLQVRNLNSLIPLKNEYKRNIRSMKMLKKSLGPS